MACLLSMVGILCLGPLPVAGSHLPTTDASNPVEMLNCANDPPLQSTITGDYRGSRRASLSQEHLIKQSWPEIVSLAILAALFLTDFFGASRNLPIAAVPAMVLAVFGLLIGHTALVRRDVNNILAFTTRIDESVKNYLHVTRLGSATQALDYITSRLPSLSEVRGTVFNFGAEGEIADDRLYDSEEYEAFESAIPLATAKGLRWKDIGQHDVVERFRRISRNAKFQAETRWRDRYQYRLVESHLPQMNFSLLIYSNGDRELLFNWDYRSTGHDPIVLLSRDAAIVNMFAVHFALLWSAASEDHDNNATRSISQT